MVKKTRLVMLTNESTISDSRTPFGLQSFFLERTTHTQKRTKGTQRTKIVFFEVVNVHHV